MAQSYYDILGVTSAATSEEIRAAYRRLSKTKHPDKNGSHDEFVELKNAHDTLVDVTKRSIYDQFGEAGLSRFQQGNPQAPPTPPYPLPKLPPITMVVPVGLGEFITGGAKSTGFQRRRHDSGRIFVEQATLDFSVNPGDEDGTEITFPGVGDLVPGFDPGDVVIKLRQKKHKSFTRAGNDLHAKATIHVCDAITGFELDLNMPDGQRETLEIDPLHGNTSMVFDGLGMPRADDPSIRGDLHISFVIKWPIIDKSSDKDAVRKVLEHLTYPK